MAGDEIVAEWLGEVYGDVIQTSSVVQRLNASSVRLRNLKIQNSHVTYEAYVGKYISSVTTFAEYAHIIQPKEIVEYEFIDLYNLGCKYASGGFLDLKIIGINRY